MNQGRSRVGNKFIWKFKNILQSEIKCRLTTALVLLQTDYCSSVYFNYLNVSLKHKLQTLQNYCLKYSFGINFRKHVALLLNDLQTEITT